MNKALIVLAEEKLALSLPCIRVGVVRIIIAHRESRTAIQTRSQRDEIPGLRLKVITLSLAVIYGTLFTVSSLSNSRTIARRRGIGKAIRT